MDESLKHSWTDFLRTPFPQDLKDTTVDHVCLISLDIFSSGCLSHYFKNKGQMSDDDREKLMVHRVDLEQIFDKLEPEGQEYFGKLKELMDACL